MSYSHLAHDPLDLDPPSDIPLDEELLVASYEDTHVYKPNSNTNTNRTNNFSSLSTPATTSLIVAPIDDKRKSYPFSLVWGGLPLISWCLPCIGHLGICDSRGEIHDFHGPYDVRKGRFMVGPVLRYYQLPQEQLEELGIKNNGQEWDEGIYRSDLHYSGTVHNIVSNNCHHHVATALTNVGYNLSMIEAWWVIMTKGRWVSGQKMICNVLLPFVIFWGLIIALIYMMFKVTA